VSLDELLRYKAREMSDTLRLASPWLQLLRYGPLQTTTKRGGGGRWGYESEEESREGRRGVGDSIV